MNRGSTVVSLVLVFVMVGTCSPPQQDLAGPAPRETYSSWWERLAALAQAEPPPPPEPKVTRILRQLRASAERDGGANRRADDPNVGVPPAVVVAALNRPASRRGVLGRLRIPAIDLDVAYRSGVHERAVKRGPGHWPGTALPGTAGRSVLSGHRTTFSHPFLHLDRLTKGDTIRTSLGTKGSVVYRVRQTTIVPESKYARFVLRKPDRDGARWLILFACHPKGSRRERIVVRAVAEPVKPPRKQIRQPDLKTGGELPPISVAATSDVRTD